MRMLLARARIALSLCAALASGCGHSGGYSLPPGGGFAPIVIAVTTSGSALTLVVGETANVTVSEGDYGGPFYGTSSNPSVASVTPATAATSIQSLRRRPLETGVASFQVTALAAGSTSVLFLDQGGHGAATTVNVSAATTPTPGATATPAPAPGVAPVILSASSLAFFAAGATYAQTISATQANSSAAFSASGASCATIATIAQTNSNTFAVTPVGAGTCSFTINGGNGASATLAITVTITNVGGT